MSRPDESVSVIEARDRPFGRHVPHVLWKIRFVRRGTTIRRVVEQAAHDYCAPQGQTCCSGSDVKLRDPHYECVSFDRVQSGS